MEHNRKEIEEALEVLNNFLTCAEAHKELFKFLPGTKETIKKIEDYRDVLNLKLDMLIIKGE